MSKRKTHVDLFSGIGTFAYCAKKHGLKTIHSVEIEKHFLDMCIKKYKSEGHSDINTFEMPKNVFVVTGGFPCQDISVANSRSIGGKQGLKGKKSGLWYQYLRCIKKGKPKYAIIENVFALLNKGLGQILQDLASIGYDSCYTILDTKYTGLPQRRRRMYIVAVRDGIPAEADLFKFKKRTFEKLQQKMELVNSGFKRYKKKTKESKSAVAYYTLQRSDQFAEKGIASTLLKTETSDLVLLKNGNIRRVTIKERMLLQGLPKNYLEGYGLTKRQSLKGNGMSVTAVDWVFDCLLEFDKKYG